MGTTGQVGSAVVARYRDGRMVKGTVQNFVPTRPLCNVSPIEGNAPYGVNVTLADLKALFFVKTFAGNKDRVDKVDPAQAGAAGRRIVVTFTDGEILTGVTTGYNASKPGFFVTPADPASNNDRVYVITKSVKSVAWTGASAGAVAGEGPSRA